MQAPTQRSRSGWAVVLCAVVIAAGHGALASVYLDHPIAYDEMYHYLAAENWPQTGEPAILDGRYTRGYWYTHFVSQAMPLCQGSLPCLRATSLLATMLLVGLVVAFTARHAGLLAGALAGGFLALAPPLLEIGLQLRFYAFHALSFFLLAMLVYALTGPPQRIGRTLLLSAGVLVMALVSLHLQDTTLIGVLGLAVAAVLVSAPVWVPRFRRLPRRTALAIAGAVAVVVAAPLIWPGAGYFLDELTSSPLWSAGLAESPLYYHHWLKDWYPVLWSAAPLLILAAVPSHTRLALFSTLVFLVCFALLSIAHAKAVRYSAFALPFLMIPLGIGAAAALQALQQHGSRLLRSPAGGFPGLAPRTAAAASLAVIVAASLAYAATQPLVRAAQRVVTNPVYEPIYGNYAHLAEWRHAVDVFEELLASPRVILSSAGIKAAYFFGDFSFDLNASVMAETDTRTEFGLDRRTGRRIISAPESLRHVMLACGPGFAVVEHHHEGHPAAVPQETVALLDEFGERIDAGDSGLVIWAWDHPPLSDVLGNGVPCTRVPPLEHALAATSGARLNPQTNR